MIISVIIPCFNAEIHINNCLDALISQIKLIREKIEVIIVNDGSTDLTSEKLHFYDKSFDFIKIINQNNLGVSSARNAGLNLSVGKYVLFLDSDDSYKEGFFKSLISKINEYDFDVLEFDFGYQKIKDRQHIKEYSNTVNGLTYFSSFTSVNSASNKLYRREFLISHQINFNSNLKIGEDLLFNINVFSFAKFVISTSKRLLIINDTNQNSVTRIKSCDKEVTIIKNFQIIFKHILLKYKSSNTLLEKKYYFKHLFKVGVILIYRFFKNFYKCRKVRNILLNFIK